MVIGDGKGRVGLGTGKSWEVVDAIAKAIADAKKNLITVKMEEGTVPYNLTAKFKAATASANIRRLTNPNLSHPDRYCATATRARHDITRP